MIDLTTNQIVGSSILIINLIPLLLKKYDLLKVTATISFFLAMLTLGGVF
ncbi:MAG: hypothetical protein AABY22_13725 [Nanoarchaeota archaeon]